MKTPIEIRFQTTYDDTGAKRAGADAAKIGHEFFSGEQMKEIRQGRTQERMLRYQAMQYISAVSFAARALGDVLPEGAEKAAQGLNRVVEGMMVGSLVAPGLGTAIGGLAGAMMWARQTFAEADPAVASLSKSLDELAQKDRVVQSLAAITGQTESAAAQMLKLAQVSPDAAKKLQAVVTAHEIENMNTLGVGVRMLQKMLEEAGNQAVTASKQLSSISFASPQLDALWGVFTLRHSRQTLAGKPEENAEQLAALQRSYEHAGQARFTDAAIEQQNVIDKMPGALAAARAEMDSYRQSLEDLNSTQLKTKAGFEKERARIEETTLKQREQIETDFNKRLAEMTRSSTRSEAEQYRSYAQSVRSIQAQIGSVIARANKDRERSFMDMLRRIQDADTQYGLRMSDATTERERDRIDLERVINQAGLQRDASERSRDLSEQVTEQLSAAEERRNELDEEFNYRQQLRDEDNAYALQRLQEETAERRNALVAQRGEQLAAVAERETESQSEYARSVMRLQSQHTLKLQQITDLRTAEQTMAADLAALAGTGLDPWIAKIQQLKQEILNLPQVNVGNGALSSSQYVNEFGDEAWR